ncbi:hypothetical protein ACH5RR_026012 [Cinchona calisaya]|uniref:RRM domain-containing protein n=1 Tax=Cinchona calisaya TaxID=153742 RepID=A0ABD2Z4N6_9GENT
MAENANCTVYVGNLDEKVSDRVLYDILIQAGRVVDLYVPRDKETDKPKGFAFAQYETEEIADYAVKLFSGLVTLYSRTLKFAISGQDKHSMNSPMVSSSYKPRSHPVANSDMGVSPNSLRLSTPCRFQEHRVNYSKERATPGLSVHQPNGYRSNFDNNYEHSNGYGSHYNSNNYDNDRRVFGAPLHNINRSRLGRYDARDSTSYYASY